MKKFKNIITSSSIKPKSLSDDYKKFKEDRKIKKKEKKELKHESKKVYKTTKELLPFLDIDDDESIITKTGFIDIFQIESRDIYSLSEDEIKICIYSFIKFLRNYSMDFKLLSLNFPVNTAAQQEYINIKIKNSTNNVYKQFLQEKLEQLEFLEKHRNNREFFIMIFAKSFKEKENLSNFLNMIQNKAVKISSISLEKKLKVLFKINNLNTKIGGALNEAD